jgi:outer membrane protein OmpA-like peptidoglycan-associated protein
MTAGAGAAQTACKDVIADFNKAIEARQMDAALRHFDDISGNPAKDCLGHLAEHRSKLVDFLLELAGTQGLAAEVRTKALDKAQKIVEVSGHWQGKEKIADYYFAQNTPESRMAAFTWYKAAVTALATPGAAPATDQQKTELTKRLAYAQSLASNDKGGRVQVAFPASRDIDGRLGGVYSPALRTVGINALPLPINFVFDRAEFTENGEKAMLELIEFAKQVPAMTLVGHADPQGQGDQRTRFRYNQDLSMRRAYAVQKRLLDNGVRGKITVLWKGDTEQIDVSALPGSENMSQEDIYQLDRRVEFRLEQK